MNVVGSSGSCSRGRREARLAQLDRIGVGIGHDIKFAITQNFLSGTGLA